MLYRFNKNLAQLTGGGDCRIIAAVSGGPDSVCMLHLLCRSIPKENLVIAHVNFNLRGEDSDADEAFVRDLAREMGVEAYFKSVDTLSYAGVHSISVEMAARDLRYAWFGELRSRLGFDYVAVAHNANDNAETLLLNLCRGTGLKGVCGMSMVDCRGILRPLLPFSRSEIEKYIESNGLPYRIDKTNASNDFSRNRIRNRVIEELRRINPSVISTLNEDIGRFRQAYLLLEGLVERCRLKSLVSPEIYFDRLKDESKAFPIIHALSESFMVAAIDIASLTATEKEACGYLLHDMLSEYGFNPAQCSDLAFNLEEAGIKKIGSSDFVAIKERGYIKIYRTAVADDILPAEVGKPLPGKSVEINYGELRLRFEILRNECCRGEGRGDGVLFVSADNLSFPLQLRAACPGERFSPFGLKGSKKLSDYYTDMKIDNAVRGRIPLLVTKKSPGAIVALPGLQVSEQFKVTGESAFLLKITLL